MASLIGLIKREAKNIDSGEYTDYYNSYSSYENMTDLNYEGDSQSETSTWSVALDPFTPAVATTEFILEKVNTISTERTGVPRWIVYSLVLAACLVIVGIWFIRKWLRKRRVKVGQRRMNGVDGSSNKENVQSDLEELTQTGEEPDVERLESGKLVLTEGNGTTP